MAGVGGDAAAIAALFETRSGLMAAGKKIEFAQGFEVVDRVSLPRGLGMVAKEDLAVAVREGEIRGLDLL